MKYQAKLTLLVGSHLNKLLAKSNLIYSPNAKQLHADQLLQYKIPQQLNSLMKRVL
jgi:hypothetical protein